MQQTRLLRFAFGVSFFTATVAGALALYAGATQRVDAMKTQDRLPSSAYALSEAALIFTSPGVTIAVKRDLGFDFGLSDDTWSFDPYNI